MFGTILDIFGYGLKSAYFLFLNKLGINITTHLQPHFASTCFVSHVIRHAYQMGSVLDNFYCCGQRDQELLTNSIMVNGLRGRLGEKFNYVSDYDPALILNNYQNTCGPLCCCFPCKLPMEVEETSLAALESLQEFESLEIFRNRAREETGVPVENEVVF